MAPLRKKPELPLLAQMHRAVRRAEASEFDRKRAAIKDQVSDVGTGQTIMKRRDKPIEWLVKNRKIGPEELRAAEEITQAIHAITRSLRCRGINYDRVDNGRSHNDEWPAKFAKVVGRYQTFASVWSARHSRYGDPTLEIIVSAVVDEAPIRKLASEHGYRFARVERGLIFGLRDYAARAGFVHGSQADKWQREAEQVFGPPVELRKAMQRARLEV